METARAICVFIIAAIFLGIAFLIRSSQKKEKAQVDNCKRTNATIVRTIFSDTGEPKYYVSFEDNGRTITAQTDHYSSETKSLSPGDQVEIGYFFIRENVARAMIFDERVIPISNVVPIIFKFFAAVGVLLFLLAASMLVKGMFF